MKKYTTPKLYKGKPITSVPKGSSKAKEEAKNIWYINYSYEGKQIRIKENLNRIKDCREKAAEAELILASLKKDLANGFNPNKTLEWAESVFRSDISLKDAIKEFKSYHLRFNSRKKTIESYLSKLKSLSNYYPEIQLSNITTKHLEEFTISKIEDGTYSNVSVSNAKRTFSAFFNTCIRLEFISVSPFIGFNSKIRSNKFVEKKHFPISDDDLITILEYMDEHDKYAAFFCRMIYYTCLRPSEIRSLKVENINLKNNTITIPKEIKKVTRIEKDDIIEIDKNFITHINNLNLRNYPNEYYLTGSFTDIVGQNKVGENTPYNKLVSVLKKLGLNKKHYDLYSFKHTSNIKKYLAGWTLAEIMKANRHTSIRTTEIYLRDLGYFIDIKSKEIPKI